MKQQLTNKDQITLLKIQVILKDLYSLIPMKEEEKPLLEEFHNLCRKYCSFGEQDEES
jgi:hypothetical protein